MTSTAKTGIRQKVDPFTVEIIRAGLIATTDEMKTSLMRTAYNAIVYEALDFTVALTDAKGNLISIGLGLPSFIRGISDTVKTLIRHFGDDIQPGDVLMTNDAYTHGSHLPHVIAARPIFVDGQVVSYACSEPHWGSWGGVVGQRAPDIFAMGLQIPPIKIYKHGVLDKEKLSFISMNIRNPDRGMGDFRGQIACIRTGEKRIARMAKRYGAEAYMQALDLIADQAEAFSRRELEKIPEGEYEAEEFLDDDGVDIGKHVPIRVKIIVKGDGMTVDLSGLGKQVRGTINSRAGVSGVQMGFKTLIAPTWFPVNDGTFRPLKVILPEGTVASAARPAPIGSWMVGPMTICDTMWQAMQNIAPTKVSGGHHASLSSSNVNPIDPKTGKLIIQRTNAGGQIGGGFGAVYNSDGQCATICMNDGDTHNSPVEAAEAGDSFALVLRYGLRQDSGGAGKFRGGLGAFKEILYFMDGMSAGGAERSICQPFGALGAKPALANATSIFVPVEKCPPEVLNSSRVLSIPRTSEDYPNPQFPSLKIGARQYPAGFVMMVKMGGGGGYGDPFERDPNAVLSDVFEGYVSAEAARRDYGVAVDEGKWSVDAAATEALRRRA